jgi:hypothetical protein
VNGFFNVEQEASRVKKMDEKLKELELNGLVEFNPGVDAKFVVLGSTGNHYTITLTNDKQSCQCVDHRIRFPPLNLCILLYRALPEALFGSAPCLCYSSGIDGIFEP